jgi:hypothetical protein
MTQKPRKRKLTAPGEVMPAPAEASVLEPNPAPPPAPPATAPVDRLSVLDDYAGPDGLLPVYVAVAHDAVFVGQHIRVPVTDRVAGLIERGFLEVDLDDQQ